MSALGIEVVDTHLGRAYGHGGFSLAICRWCFGTPTRESRSRSKSIRLRETTSRAPYETCSRKQRSRSLTTDDGRPNEARTGIGSVQGDREGSGVRNSSRTAGTKEVRR